MSSSTSLLRMKPPCVVKPLHLCSPKATRSRKRRRNSCFHNLNGYVANAVRLDKSNIKVERPRFHCNTWCQVPCPKGRGLSLAFHQPTAHAVDRHNPQPQV